MLNIIRTILVIIIAILLYAILIPLVSIVSLLQRDKEYWYLASALFWHKALLRAGGIKISVEGRENLKDLPAQAVFIANHASYFDISVLTTVLPFGIRFVARDSLFRAPFLGYVIRHSGHIAIERKGSKKTLKSLQQAAAKVSSGQRLIIFPEGTRSLDGAIHPFKKGSLLIAKKARAAIIPVILQGVGEIMPKDKLLIKGAQVMVKICPPYLDFQTTEQVKIDEESVLQELQSLMKHELANLK